MSEQEPNSLKLSDLSEVEQQLLNGAVDTLLIEGAYKVGNENNRKSIIEKILKDGKKGVDHAIMVASVYKSKANERAVSTENYVRR